MKTMAVLLVKEKPSVVRKMSLIIHQSEHEIMVNVEGFSAKEVWRSLSVVINVYSSQALTLWAVVCINEHSIATQIVIFVTL